MKRILVAAAALLLLLAACSQAPVATPTPRQIPLATPTLTPSPEPSPSPTDTGLVVRGENGSVRLTLPAAILEQTDLNGLGQFPEPGVENVTWNDDGSLSMTLTQERYQELLQQVAQEMDGAYLDLVEGQNTPYIRNIERGEGFRTITVDVDREEYEALSVDISPAVGMYACLYQAFTTDTPSVQVVLRDYDTGETLHTTVYSDGLETEDS